MSNRMSLAEKDYAFRQFWFQISVDPQENELFTLSATVPITMGLVIIPLWGFKESLELMYVLCLSRALQCSKIQNRWHFMKFPTLNTLRH